MTSTTVRALSQSDVFRSLDEAELVRLASACGQRTYGRGELVFLRGDPGDCMYVIAAGAVAVSMSSVGGRDLLLAVLGPNQSFGELALVDDGPRVATVTARSRSVLVVVPRRAAAEVMARQPTVVTALLVSLAALVRRLDEQACDAALLNLPRRVEKHLAALARGRATTAEGLDGWVPVDVSLTQGDLARQIGGSRQQVNRVLMDLEAAGSITRRGHRIVGIRPHQLYTDDSTP
jgi:CRP/FNR family transcriptional regulator, cyclic AMP receptor protein